MTGIIEGSFYPVGFVISLFMAIIGILAVLKFFEIWPTLAIKATEICIGGACP